MERLRRRGQRPAGGVFITDDYRQRENLEDSGIFAVTFPSEETIRLVVGLDIVLIADPCDAATEMALDIASARPRSFATYFRGRGLEVVL